MFYNKHGPRLCHLSTKLQSLGIHQTLSFLVSPTSRANSKVKSFPYVLKIDVTGPGCMVSIVNTHLAHLSPYVLFCVWGGSRTVKKYG